MKKSFSLFLTLAPLFVAAQVHFSLSEPAPPTTQLFRINHATIMIHPIGDANEAHKWLAFDDSLRLMAAKKLVNRESAYVISQNYLPRQESIVRFDQMLVDSNLYVSLFEFDAQGNVLNVQELTVSVPDGNALPQPFIISQSPDKESFSLVQALPVSEDSLQLTVLSIGKNLQQLFSRQYSIPFDADLMDLFLPLVDNAGNVYITTADKFDSYKLNSKLQCFVSSASLFNPDAITIEFDRKKVKGLEFYIPADTFYFKALYSLGNNKKDVAGMVQGGFNVKTKQQLAQKVLPFDDDLKTAIKKNFGAEGRKGNLLNYIATLPQPSVTWSSNSYAVLMPANAHTPTTAGNKLPQPPRDIEIVKHQQAYVNSFVGTTPPGFSKPLNFAEASAYAATNTGNITASMPDYYISPAFRSKVKPPVQKQTGKQVKNLLFLDAGKNHQLLKLMLPLDAAYQYFAYLPDKDYYGALHYFAPTFGTLYLKLTTIDLNGVVEEKKVYENKNNLILPGYPHVKVNNSLITFYADKVTGQMGLVKLVL